MLALPTNANAGKFARIGLLPSECEFARARQRGWNDWLAAKPFRRSYDGWKRRKQYAYERGRLQAALASALAVRPLTRWADNELLFPTVYLRSMGFDAAQRVHDETKVARKARKGKT